MTNKRTIRRQSVEPKPHKHTGMIQANPEVVAEGTKALLEAFNKFVEAGKSSTDCFMIAHSFHMAIIEVVAKEWEHEIPKGQTYRMADMTFRKAIREEWRKL